MNGFLTTDTKATNRSRAPRAITKVTGWRVRNVRTYDHLVSDEHYQCDVLLEAHRTVVLWQPIVFVSRSNPRYHSIYGLDRFGQQTADQLHDAIIAAVQAFQWGARAVQA